MQAPDPSQPDPRLTHYLDIILKMPKIHYELHARLLLAMHKVISRSNLPLAAAWPDWPQNRGFGLVFRAFGTPGDLQVFREFAQPLANHGMIYLPAQPLPVPPTKETVAYVADLAVERRTPGFAVRERRRNAARGFVPTNSRPAPTENYRSGRCLQLQSTSTQRLFQLDVAKKAASHSLAKRAFGIGFTLPNF